MSKRRKARYRDARQQRLRIEACPQRDRDRRSSYLGRAVSSPANDAPREKKDEKKKINQTAGDWSGMGREGENANNNNKQRYRRGLMLILIDRAIHDPDFNFGRDVCANSPLRHNRAVWIIQAEIIMCARAIIIQVKYNYIETRGMKERDMADDSVANSEISTCRKCIHASLSTT